MARRTRRSPTRLVGLLQQADDRGEAESYALQRLHLCELELRAGDWAAAGHLLDEWAESAERGLLNLPMYERCRALLAMGRGRVDQARHSAAQAIIRADAYGDGWDRLEALRARGTAALLARDPSAAAADLGAVHEHAEREGVADPGVFPVVPGLVEALAELGDLDRARSVTETLTRQSRDQAHPWRLVTARRCHAHVRLAASQYDHAAGAALAGAAAELAGLGLAFDSARCQLSLGRAQRRTKQGGSARKSLERAAALFAQLGSAGWQNARRRNWHGSAAASRRCRERSRRQSRTSCNWPRTAWPTRRSRSSCRSRCIPSRRTCPGPTPKLGVRSRAQLAAQLTSWPADQINS